jgi:amino acid transporter
MSEKSGLKRSLSLLDVSALGINGIIGQGIFLLPGLAVLAMGPASLVAIIVAGVLSFLIALCFAEVGSQFKSTGGAYVYAKEAFGDFVGFEVGWMTCCVAVISWAALANGFTKVMSHFVPAVGSGWIQKLTIVGLMAVLSAVNLRGAKKGALLSTVMSVAKLVPILIFIAVGAFFMDGANFEPFAPNGYSSLAETTLLLLYAFVGFETLVVPAGEMANPQRSVPLAMMIVMSVVSVVYIAVLTVALGTFPDIAGHGNPVAEASRQFMGPLGGTLVAAGIVISVFGTNAGAALVSPRRFYALAERGDLPPKLAYVNPQTGAPTYSILALFGLSALLALSGTFKELAILGVMARFLQYIPTCLAVIVLRKKGRQTPGFKLPMGPVLPLITVGICVWLMFNADLKPILYGVAALALGLPLYKLAKMRQRKEGN